MRRTPLIVATVLSLLAAQAATETFEKQVSVALEAAADSMRFVPKNEGSLIVDGVEVLADENRNYRPIVGFVVYDPTEKRPISLCSGTFVSPSVIATAGHCFPDYKKGYQIYYTEDIRISSALFEDIPASLSDQRLAKSTGDPFLHPQYNENTLANDIALFKVDAPGHPFFHIDTDPVKKGESVIFAGYGKSSRSCHSPEPFECGVGIKRIGVNKVSSGKGDALSVIGRTGTAETAKDHRLASSGASGDSGGPLLVSRRMKASDPGKKAARSAPEGRCLAGIVSSTGRDVLVPKKKEKVTVVNHQTVFTRLSDAKIVSFLKDAVAAGYDIRFNQSPD